MKVFVSLFLVWIATVPTCASHAETPDKGAELGAFAALLEEGTAPQASGPVLTLD